MKITVNVTQDDIENGWKASAFSCPIARACARAMPYYAEAGVSCHRISVYSRLGMEPSRSIRTPVIVQDFINAFDDDKKVEPFTFELDLE